MAKLSIVKGATSVLTRIFVQDSTSTTGAGKTGLTASSFAGTACYVARDDDGNAAGTSVTLTNSTRGTWSSGGIKEKDATNMPGIYEFGLTNASLATGSRSCTYYLSGTGIAPVVLEIELTGVDNQDAVHFGLSAIPNATAGASTGLLISGTNAGTTTFGAVTVTGATTLTGNVSCSGTFGVTGTVTLSDGLVVNRSTANSSAIVATGSGTGSGMSLTGGAAASTLSAGHGLFVVGGAAATGTGATAGIAVNAVGGAGAASTNPAGVAFSLAGGGTTTTGGAAGILVSGTGNANAATFTGSGTGVGISASAITCTNNFLVSGTTTLTGAVSFGSTFAVTGTVTYNAFTVTNNLTVSGTTTLTGAVSLGSTLGVTGTTTFAAVTTTGTLTVNAFTCSNNFLISGTTTCTGAVSFSSTFGVTGTVTYNAFTITNALTVSGSTTLTGTATLSDGLLVNRSTANSNAVIFTGSGSGSGMKLVGGAAVTTTAAGHGLLVVGGAASTGAGGVAGNGFNVTGGAGAASTNGAADGVSLNGGGTTTVSGANGITMTGTGNLNGASFQGAGTGVGMLVSAFTCTNNFLVSGTTTHTGAVSFGSTFGVTGTVTYNAFTVTNAFTVSGTTSLAAVTTSGTVTFNAFTVTNALLVSGTTTLTGAVAFSSSFTVTGTTTLSDGFLVNRSTSNSNAVVFTGSGSGSGMKLVGGAAVTTTAAGHGLLVVGGAASTSAGGTAGNGFNVTGGAGAASTNGAGDGVSLNGGGGTTTAGANGITMTGTGNLNGASFQGAGSGVGILASAITCSNNLLVSGTTTYIGAVLLSSSLTVNGIVTFASTFNVTSTTSLGVVNAGAVTFNSFTCTNNLLVSGTTTCTGAVAFSSSFAITGTTTLSDGLLVNRSTANSNAVVFTGSGSGSGMKLVGGAAVTTTAAGHGLLVVGGAASTGAGGVAGNGLNVTGGAGAASTNAAADGVILNGGGGNTTTGGANGITVNGTINSNGASFQGAGTGVGILASAITCTNNFLVSGTTTHTGAVSFGSTFAVTGTTTLAALTATGTMTVNAFTCTNNFLVSGTTTHTGAVSFGSTFGVTGTVTYNAFTVTNNVAFGGTFTVTSTVTYNAFTVSGATQLSGNVAMQAGLNITQSSSNASALVVTGNGTGHGAIFTSGGGVTGDGFKAVAASTNGHGMTLVHAGTGFDLNATTTPPMVVNGSGASAATVATAVWQDLRSGGDFTTTGSIGKYLSSLAISATGGVTLADGVAHGGTPGSSTATLALSRFLMKGITDNVPTFEIRHESASGGDTIKVFNDHASFSAVNVVGGNGDTVLTIGGASACLDIGGGATIPAVLFRGPVTTPGPAWVIDCTTAGGLSLDGGPGIQIKTGAGDGIQITAVGSGKHDIALRGTGDILGNLNGSVTSVTNPATIATAVWTDTTGSDFTTLTSPGKIIFAQLGGAFTTTSSSVFSVAALANAPSGGGGSTPAQIATAVWQDLIAIGGDFTVSGSIGNLLANGVNVAQWATKPVTVDGNNLPNVNTQDIGGTLTAGSGGYVGIDWAAIIHQVASVHFPFTTVGIVGQVNQVNYPGVTDIATAILQDTNPGDFTVTGSVGSILVNQLGGTFTTNTSSVFSATALANVPTVVWQDLTSSGDFLVPGSIGNLLVSNIDSPTSAPKVLASNGLDGITVETGLNARQSLSIIGASSAGVLAGLPGTTITISALGSPSTHRIVATVDANDNRTAITLSPPP